MPKLITEVPASRPDFDSGFGHRIMVLGSCFADSVGAKMLAAGLDVCLNPFGTLYNPASISSAIGRLGSGRAFEERDCVQMGAGSQLICSFSHHTRFARATSEEFLENANRTLAEASGFWKGCDRVIITLGTSMVWKRRDNGETVSNCLKRPEAEFLHERLTVEEIASGLKRMFSSYPEKKFIISISPIRHLSEGAHENSLNKACLLLGVEQAMKAADNAYYFPSYEIVLDELRDYRFYAEDLVHPSNTAVELIWERFQDAFIPSAQKSRIIENEKAARRAAHRNIH